MKTYILILSNGTEVYVTAGSYVITGNEISFLSEDGKSQIAFAPSFLFVSLKKSQE